jgi:hypothetical protein
MTNRIALALAVLLIAALVADRVLSGGEASQDLARRFVVFIDWIAFWR